MCTGLHDKRLMLKLLQSRDSALAATTMSFCMLAAFVAYKDE